MLPLHLLEDLSPHARVATAVAPFVLALVLRVVLGRSRLTSLMVSLSTVWFAINIFLAPYSARMREDIRELQNILR